MARGICWNATSPGPASSANLRARTASPWVTRDDCCSSGNGAAHWHTAPGRRKALARTPWAWWQNLLAFVERQNVGRSGLFEQLDVTLQAINTQEAGAWGCASA